MMTTIPASPTSGLQPDPHAFDSFQKKVLWSLATIGDWTTASDISVYLRDVCQISSSRQQVGAELAAAEKAGLVTHEGKGRRQAGRPRRYKIMKAGSDCLVPPAGNCLYIDPSSAFSGIRSIEALVASLEGDLRICDPYLDKSSLDYFAQPTAATSIRLLSQPIQKPNPFRRDLKALRSEYATPIQVREHPAGTLHDRYIVHDSGLILLGTSLNGLGNKQSMVCEAGTNLRSLVKSAFDQFWSNATEFQ
jgi:hypothetical protein